MRFRNTLALLLLAGCGGASSGRDAGPQPDGAVDGDASPQALDAGSGSGTITGSADGTPFTSVAQAIWLGAPDDPSTTVVYVFSKPVACSDLSSPGWDKRIADATQFLEMKMFGLAPATYTVVTTPTPAPGEASVNYTLSSQSGTPQETSASGATVTLDALQPQAVVTGSFNVTFGSNTLKGTYSAVYCPGGHEP